jgi:hypothetical protein
MTFRAPTLSSYLIGLTIIAILAGAGTLALPAGLEALKILAAGLFLGHLVGSFIGPKAASAGSPAPKTEKAAPAPRDAGGSISLYVGNIAFNANKSALQKLFETYGQVKSVRIMTDRQTRKPRGYGFVEMDEAGAKAAMKALDGSEFCGRSLRVTEAQQKKNDEY